MEKGTNRFDTGDMGGLIDADDGESPVAFLPQAIQPPGALLLAGTRVGFVRDNDNEERATQVKRLAMELGVVVANPLGVAPDDGGVMLPFDEALLEPSGLRLAEGDRVRFHRNSDGGLLLVKRSRAKRP